MSPLEIFFSAPPIARTLTAVTLTFSILIYTYLLPFNLFNLYLSSLIRLPPELWRIFTSLLITRPGLGLLFDTYFLYVYGAKLEIASPRFTQRAEFATYICFVSGVILILNLFITYGSVFASVLAMSFITTSTFDSWDEPITFFVIRMPCQYLPYAFLFLSLILEGPQSAMVQATGLAAAHLYNLMTGLYPNFGVQRNLITTPGFMMRIFGTQDVVQRPYGTVMPGVTGQAAWGLDLSWKRFGPGRTLGGQGSSTTRQRPKGWVLASMVMIGFLAFCCFLGFLFVMYGAPRGWLSGIGVSASGVSQAESVGAVAGTTKTVTT